MHAWLLTTVPQQGLANCDSKIPTRYRNQTYYMDLSLSARIAHLIECLAHSLSHQPEPSG